VHCSLRTHHQVTLKPLNKQNVCCVTVCTFKISIQYNCNERPSAKITLHTTIGNVINT